jgi:hypothetical protein
MNALAQCARARRKAEAKCLAVVIASWLTVGVSLDAQAAFLQRCTTNQLIEFKYDTSSGSTLRERALPHPGVLLQNNVNTYIDFVANQNVTGVRFGFSTLDLELGEDFFRIFDNANPAHNTVLTGTSSNRQIMVAFDAIQAEGAYFQLQTDATIGSKNVIIDGATTICGPPSEVGYASLKLGRRTMGLLTGTDDTVYMRVPLPPNNHQQTTLAMWTETSGKDFDLYVRCNALPTPTAFTDRGFSSTSHEFVTIPAGTCPGGTMYVAVNSHSGSGTFSLVASHSFVQPPLHVVTNFAATNAQIDQFADSMVLGMKTLYGLTEGGWYAPQIKICNQAQANQCPSPSFVFDNSASCTRSYANFGMGYGRGEAHICPQSWAIGGIIAHEAGHALLHLFDEYEDQAGVQGSLSRCGHTYYGATPYNFNLCRQAVHFLDKHPDSNIFDPGQPSGWSSMNTCTAETPTTCWVPKQMISAGAAETPDNFRYNTFSPPSALPPFAKVTKFY